jgi:NAD(P)-dependent dehydrogenase (short-subunit alcohol dehydrogenase family)
LPFDRHVPCRISGLPTWFERFLVRRLAAVAAAIQGMTFDGRWLGDCPIARSSPVLPGAIGGAIARRLAECGVNVVATDLRPASELSPNTRWVTAHLTKTEGRATLVTAIDGSLGGLVYAAGILDPASWDAVSEEDFSRIFAVNVKAPFLLIRALRSRLALDASIVLVGSIAGERGSPNAAAYAASKATLRNLAATLALALAPDRVWVNTLAPGLIDTPLTDALNHRLASAAGREADDIGEERRAAVPIGRLGTVDEIADACLYLIGDGARYLTGATLFATGGVLAGTI